MSKSIIKKVLDNRMARRYLARPITKFRNSSALMNLRKKLGGVGDPWLHVKEKEQFAEPLRKYPVNFRGMLERQAGQVVGLIADKNDPVVSDFINACADLDVKYYMFDPKSPKFIRDISNSKCCVIIVRPSHVTGQIRQFHMEKIETVCREISCYIYPSYRELAFYESKRNLADFLSIHNVPHPKTWIFFEKEDALKFLGEADFPIVFKTNTGAGASGVEIIQNKEQAKKLTLEMFDQYYLNKSVPDYRDFDWGYIIFQQYIHEVREYRVIKIGESWFGHEKDKFEHQQFMSGSGVNKWTPPSKELLDFCKNMAERFSFTTMCFDIFEDKNGNYLVNELQTWFGSYNPSQMYIDDIPGRYVMSKGGWQFEKGMFNQNGSLSLRVVDALNCVNKSQSNN